MYSSLLFPPVSFFLNMIQCHCLKISLQFPGWFWIVTGGVFADLARFSRLSNEDWQPLCDPWLEPTLFLFSKLHLSLFDRPSLLGMQGPNAGDAVPGEWLREAEADLLAADLKCSFFVSALQSYKRDSVLRPFPSLYATEETKDFEALVSSKTKQNNPNKSGFIHALACVECVNRWGCLAPSQWKEGNLQNKFKNSDKNWYSIVTKRLSCELVQILLLPWTHLAALGKPYPLLLRYGNKNMDLPYQGCCKDYVMLSPVIVY